MANEFWAELEKLLTGCSTQDVETVLNFNDNFMHYLYIPKA